MFKKKSSWDFKKQTAEVWFRNKHAVQTLLLNSPVKWKDDYNHPWWSIYVRLLFAQRPRWKFFLKDVQTSAVARVFSQRGRHCETVSLETHRARREKKKNIGPNLSSKAAIQAKSPNYVCWWRKRQRLATLCTNIHTHTHTQRMSSFFFSLKKCSCLREVTQAERKKGNVEEKSTMEWDKVRV